MHADPYLSISNEVKENKLIHVHVQNRIYRIYLQYTWKVTVKDFTLGKVAGLQLTALLKNELFHGYFSRKFHLFRNSFIRKFSNGYDEIL